MERFRNPPPKSHWQRCLLKVHGLQHVVFDEAWCCLGIVGPPSETEGLKNSAMVGHVTCTYYISISISIYILHMQYLNHATIYVFNMMYIDIYSYKYEEKWIPDTCLKPAQGSPVGLGSLPKCRSRLLTWPLDDTAKNGYGPGVPGVHFGGERRVCICMYICVCIYICSRLLKLRNPQNHGFQYSQIC